MAFWRQLTRGIRVLLDRTAADRDIADEVEQYLDEATASLEADGLSHEEARRAARRQLGSVTGVREQVREHGWEHVVDTTVTDVRHGVWRLRRSPVFAILGALTLALGVGATLQRDIPRALSTAAVPGCGPPDDDLGSPERDPDGHHVRDLS